MSWENVDKLQKFTSAYKNGSSIEMISGGKKARLMLTARLSGEHTFGLPPGRAAQVFHVDSLPGCPEDWVRGDGSYVVPISPGVAFWFDWTMNDNLNTAVLPSVKGMNPYTGRKIEELKLNKHKGKCPVHDVEFKGGDRFCEACGFKWLPQNYCCSPNILWADGFNQPDGSVRQFFFTEDEERDIASAVIGKKNVVPAFGFAFFEPKKRREHPPAPVTRGGVYWSNNQYCFGGGLIGSSKINELDNTYYPDNDVYYGVSGSAPEISCSTAPQNYSCDDVKGIAPAAAQALRSKRLATQTFTKGNGVRVSDVTLQNLEKTVAVGAGAKISQDLVEDPLSIEDWKDEPSSLIRLYFVFQPKFEKIVGKGLKDLNGDPEGFLKGLPVG